MIAVSNWLRRISLQGLGFKTWLICRESQFVYKKIGLGIWTKSLPWRREGGGGEREDLKKLLSSNVQMSGRDVDTSNWSMHYCYVTKHDLHMTAIGGHD